jgi:hypothetical protein
MECTILDGKYNEDDYDVLLKIIFTPPKTYIAYAWDGLEWRNKNLGVNRVYDNENSQNEYDDFLNRLESLENSSLLYEQALDLKEDQSFYFEKERIYIYIESRKEIIE